MRIVYKRYFKIVFLFVQFLILQPLVLQNSVANDDSENAKEQSHQQPEEHQSKSDIPEWNESIFALPSQNKSNYNTLSQNNTELEFRCSRSTTNKKTSKVSIAFDDLPAAISTFKGSKKRHYLPLMKLAGQYKQLLLIGQLESMNKNRYTDFYTFSILNNKQNVKNEKRLLYIINEIQKNNKENKYSSEEYNLLECIPPTAIGFSYNLNKNNSILPLYIELNPWQLFNQLSDSETLDISSLPILKRHPYLQHFYVSIARYGNDKLAIDVKPKLATSNGDNITSTENLDVLIPKSGKRLMIYCESITPEKQITIELKNAEPFIIKETNPITCDECHLLSCDCTKKSNNKNIHTGYIEIAKTGIKNFFASIKPSFCTANKKKNGEDVQGLSMLLGDYDAMQTTRNKIGDAVAVASLAASVYLPNMGLPSEITNPIRAISTCLSAFKVADMFTGNTNTKQSPKQSNAKQAEAPQFTAKASPANMHASASTSEKHRYEHTINKEKTPAFAETVKVNKQRTTYGLQANSNATSAEWKMFKKKESIKKAPELIEALQVGEDICNNDEEDTSDEDINNEKKTSIANKGGVGGGSMLIKNIMLGLGFFGNYICVNSAPTSSRLKRAARTISITQGETIAKIGRVGYLPPYADYQLENDINVSNLTWANDISFIGSLDCNFHKISGLRQNIFFNMHQNGIISNCELADFNVTVTGISDSKRIFGLLVFRASGNAQISNNHFSNGYIFSDCNHCAISVITGDSIEFMKIINNTAEGLRLETLGDNSPISFCISTTSNDIIEITGNTVIGSTMLTSGNNSGISIGVNKLYTFNLVGKLNINDNALLKSKIQASGTNSRFAVGIVSSNAIDKQIVTCYNNLLLNSTVIMTGNNGHIGIGIALVASTYSAVNNTAIDSNLIATGENSAISAGVGFSKHTNKTSDIRKLIAGNTMINCNISNKKNPELVHAGLGNYKAGSSAGINISTSMSVNNILNGEPFKENVGENAIGKCKHVNPCFLSHDCKINYEGISQAMLSIKNNNYLNGNSSFNCTDPLLRTIPVLAAPLAIGWGLAAAGFVGAAAGAGCCYQWYQGYQTGDRGRKLAKRPLVKTLDCLEAVGGWCLSGYGNASKNGKNTTTKEVTPNRAGNIEDNGAGESESFIQQQNNDAASQSCWSRLCGKQTEAGFERKVKKAVEIELNKLLVRTEEPETEAETGAVALFGGQGTSKERMTTEFNVLNINNRIDAVAARYVKQKFAEAVSRQLYGVEAVVDGNDANGQQVKSIESAASNMN